MRRGSGAEASPPRLSPLWPRPSVSWSVGTVAGQARRAAAADRDEVLCRELCHYGLRARVGSNRTCPPVVSRHAAALVLRLDRRPRDGRDHGGAVRIGRLARGQDLRRGDQYGDRSASPVCCPPCCLAPLSMPNDRGSGLRLRVGRTTGPALRRAGAVAEYALRAVMLRRVRAVGAV
jgi:hypothetical protein